MKQTSEIKLNYQQNETKFIVVLIIIALISTVIAVTAFLAKIKVHSKDRTLPEQIDFPIDYPVLEGVDPEERVLFEGFRTSFLPDEELMLCQFNSKPKRDVPEDNDTSDIMFLWDFPEEVTVSTRLKRKSNSTSNNDTSSSADHDNNEFENNQVEEEEYADDDHYVEEGDNNNENDEEGEYCNESYEIGDNNNKNYEDHYEKAYKNEDELQKTDSIKPHSDYPHHIIKDDENASFKSNTFLRNSSEEEVNCTTKLKRNCMNDSNTDMKTSEKVFSTKKSRKLKWKANSTSKKDSEENNATDYINKEDVNYKDGDIFIYVNNEEGGSETETKETNCMDEEDEENEDNGDKNYVEKGRKKASNKTNAINKRGKGYVQKGGRKENNETNPNGKEDANYVEEVEEEPNYLEDDGKANNKTNYLNKGDKDNVEKGGRKENNETNPNGKEDANYVEEDVDYVQGDDGKANDNKLNKGEKDNVEKGRTKTNNKTYLINNKGDKNYQEKGGNKANNKTNSINKGDMEYVEKGGRKANNNTNSINKGEDEENEDNIERGGCDKKNEIDFIDGKYKENENNTINVDVDNVAGEDRKAKNKTNSMNKEDKDYEDVCVKRADGKAKNKTNSINKGDEDYVEKAGRKGKKENNPNGKADANDVEGGSGKENNETNTEGKEDDKVYEEPEDELRTKKGLNNEIGRGSDDGTSKYDVYYGGDEIEKKGENDKSKVKHKNDKYKGIERKSSKKNCSKKKPKGSRKLKRKSNAPSKRDSGSDNGTFYNDDSDNYNEGDKVQKDGYNDKSDDENESIESMVRPPHVDRGPLDDVVEQVRGQPELEEGEMPSSVHLYKPAKLHSGIHALFKGQGDKSTIRATQASIMRRNMDAEADPCQDFYQYACGNWAALNPIPADKAGYDTFEMLRENLDSILKDLLEFNKDEQIKSKYPGPHLDTKDNLLKRITYQTPNKEQHQTTVKVQLREVLKGTNKRKYRYDWKKAEQEKTKIANRIRHILNRKPRATLKQLKVHHTTLFHSTIKRPNERHKRSLKQKRLVKQSLKYYPRQKFTPKRSNNPDTIFHRRKIQGTNGNRKHRPKREMKYNNPEKPSNNDDEAAGDAAMKARFLFKSCMNYGILQKRGHQPLLDLLNLLGGWPILDPTWHKTDFDWLELMAKLRVYNNDILISEWVGPDIKNSDEFVIQFDQTSLGLPTREYFLQDSNKVYLNAYKNYLIKIALLLGGDKQFVEESAEKLIDFEIQLAKITSAPEDRRNVSELYRRMTLQKLENMVPEVKWRRYLCVVMNRTVYPNETVVLFALNYVRHLVTLIHKTDSRILSNYLLWRFVRHRVNNLDDRFQSAKQQFYFILFGREQAPPRWKNCISQVNSNMGMALGSMFVKKYFDETSKNDTLTMTREIQQSFRELLHKINWIDNDTKKLAAHKVDAMMLRIGYPNFILSKDQLNERYKEVRIHPDKYFENILNILQHLTQMEQSRIGQPVNKTLWNTAPAVVNAYYSRNKNQIMFPAGILQPPFYHRHFPRSLNYGGIGVVIGHEITHGFDDKGRLFDCNGNLHRWWSDTAIESFHRRAQCLIDQYGQYVVPEVSMKLDGINTQGENIADNGGVKQAFRAYKHWVQEHGAEGETLPGLNHTHTQLFFLNFAQVWCGAMRPEAMRNKLKTAVHSPGRFRVIGTLSNSVDFAREFKCPPGSPMNPTNKCTVW